MLAEEYRAPAPRPTTTRPDCAPNPKKMGGNPKYAAVETDTARRRRVVRTATRSGRDTGDANTDYSFHASTRRDARNAASSATVSYR
jgi:hypothetical protein